jgi:hypothetical protein
MRAISSPDLVNVPSGGCVESVLIVCAHFRFPVVVLLLAFGM